MDIQRRVRAVIIKDGSVVLIKRVKPEEVYWVFPGGGVEEDETSEMALKREVLEETGLVVTVGEWIYQDMDEYGQENLFFDCSEINGILGSGIGPEFRDSAYANSGKYEPQYVSLSEISELNIRPQEMKEILMKRGFSSARG